MRRDVDGVATLQGVCRAAILTRDMKSLVMRHSPVSSPAASHAVGATVERQLLEAVQRAVKSASGRIAVVLHLSWLTAPAPRPHHRRIARALLQDTAGRYDGQVFLLGCGDMVVLCHAPQQEGALPAVRGTVAEPAALPDIMGRLFQADTPNTVKLVSLWPTETHGDTLLTYATECLGQRAVHASMDDCMNGQTGMLDAISSVVSHAAISDMMQRQTAIYLPGGADKGGRDLRPLFREVTFSVAALEARIATGSVASADPFLFRHLATRMDQRMLEVLAGQIGHGGPLDLTYLMGAKQNPTPPVLHLNLTLDGVLSPAFDRFARSCAVAAAPLGVEISLIEVVADPRAFARARALLAEAGLQLVLDGVSYLSLLISRPWALRPDLLKLDWSPRLGELSDGDDRSIDEALSRIEVARVVLHRAETEAAVRWGLARGIRRFQGRHVDAMLGAARIVGCGHAHRCTLRQCIERGAATGSAGRSGCGNTDLLDAGAPGRGVVLPSATVPLPNRISEAMT